VANSLPGGVHLVRVTIDDRERPVYATCGSRKDAITQVLNAVPEGWTAALRPNRLTADEVAALALKPGEVREIRQGLWVSGRCRPFGGDYRGHSTDQTRNTPARVRAVTAVKRRRASQARVSVKGGGLVKVSPHACTHNCLVAS
jgi:hypothetical protein